MKVLVHALADEDLAEAARWYGKQSEGLDDEFEAEVLAALDVIAEAPWAFRQWEDTPEIRVFPMERFPFLIAYTPLPGGEALLILAIAHSSRQPGYWLDRL